MFWKGLIDIEKIWVQIEFYPRHVQGVILTEKDFDILDDITFTIENNQYPSIQGDIFTICKNDLKFSNGENITGENLCEMLRSKQ
jgi:hypothetical protein